MQVGHKGLGGENNYVGGDQFRDDKTDATSAGGPRPSQNSLPSRKWHFKGKLAVIDGPGIGQEVFIGRNHFTVGRAHSCSLTLDCHRVSRIHAQIVCLGDDAILEDMGSTNGTYVNDQRVTKRILVPGDKIEIGDSLMEYRK